MMVKTKEGDPMTGLLGIGVVVIIVIILFVLFAVLGDNDGK